MAEFASVPVQVVQSNQNAVLTETVVRGGKFINHREGAGIITLAGVNCGVARYKVTAYGNIAIPEGGTVAPIQLAIALNGEVLQSTIAEVTPAAADQYFNVATGAVICVPSSCCVQVSVKNAGTDPINVKNLNVIVERVA